MQKFDLDNQGIKSIIANERAADIDVLSTRASKGLIENIGTSTKMTEEQCTWLLKNLIETFSYLKLKKQNDINPDVFLILLLLPPLVDSEYKADNDVFTESSVDFGSFAHALLVISDTNDTLLENVRPDDIVYSIIGLHCTLLDILDKTSNTNNRFITLQSLCENALFNMFEAISPEVWEQLNKAHTALQLMRVRPLAFTLLNVFMEYRDTKNNKETLRMYKTIMKNQIKLTIDF